MGKRIHRHDTDPTPRPALKHGVFSAATILPGEDPAQFKQLIEELCAELCPSGPIENDLVLTVGCRLWRKRRLAIFQKAARARALFGSVFENSHKPGWDEENTLRLHITNRVKQTYELLKLEMDARESITQFNARLEELNRSWLEVLGKSEKEMGDESSILYALAKLGDAITPEHYAMVMELEEKIDASIDRAIKRFMQYKTMKAVVASTSDRTPTQIPVSSEHRKE